MKKLITDSQRREIEGLAVEHLDALVAYGADLYRKGFVKGAITGMIGITSGFLFVAARNELKEINELKQDQ